MSRLLHHRRSTLANNIRRRSSIICDKIIGHLTWAWNGGKTMVESDSRVSISEQPRDYLHLDYVKELEARNKQLEPNELIYKLNRRIIKLLGFIACLELNLTTSESQRRNISQSRRFSASKSDGDHFWNKRTRSSQLLASLDYLARKLMLFVQYLIGSYLLIALYYHYQYDFDLIRLKRLKERNDGGHQFTGLDQAGELELAPSSDTSGAELELTQRMQETKSIVNIIGAPYLHFSMVIETIYSFILSLSLLTFHAMYIYYKFVAVFDFHIVRENLDYEQECRRLKQLIESQVSRFIISERIYAKLQSEVERRGQVQRQSIYCKFPTNVVYPSIFGSSNSSNYTEFMRMEGRKMYKNSHRLPIVLSHQIDQKQQSLSNSSSTTSNQSILAEMLACGALLPINRSRDWFETRLKLTFVHQMLTSSGLVLFFSFILSILIIDSDPNRTFTISDMLNNISIISLVALITAACTFWTTYSIMATLDQIVLLNKLLEMTDRCVRLNSNEFLSCHSGTLSDSVATAKSWPAPKATIGEDSNDWPNRHERKVVDKLNTNLLFIVVHYKIFVAQCKPVMKSLDPLIIVVSLVLLLIPLIVRLHLPYLNMFREKDIRYFATGLSLVMMLVSNHTMLPLCYFHSRCEDLYRALSSLLAHVIEVENECPGRNMYDRHTVSLLMKEMSDPERFLEQFRARFASLSGTYTTLVKVHFWWGILSISILVDTKLTGQGSFDSLFNDPLGIF